MALKKELAGVAEKVRPDVSQAIRNLITASDYRDKTLVRSHRNSLFEALALLLRDEIAEQVQISESIMSRVKEIWPSQIVGTAFPADFYDEAVKALRPVINERIVIMTSMRDEAAASLGQRGYQVENARQLDDVITAMRRLSWRPGP